MLMICIYSVIVGWHLDKWRELETYLEMRIRILFEFHTGEICLITAAFKSFTRFFLNSVFFYRYLSLNHPQQGIMSYGSIDGGSFGSRNPFGGPTRQGYQPVGKDIGFYEEKHLRHKCVALSNPKHCDNSPIKGTTPSPELFFFWYHFGRERSGLVSHNPDGFVKSYAGEISFLFTFLSLVM